MKTPNFEKNQQKTLKKQAKIEEIQQKFIDFFKEYLPFFTIYLQFVENMSEFCPNRPGWSNENYSYLLTVNQKQGKFDQIFAKNQQVLAHFPIKNRDFCLKNFENDEKIEKFLSNSGFFKKLSYSENFDFHFNYKQKLKIVDMPVPYKNYIKIKYKYVGRLYFKYFELQNIIPNLVHQEEGGGGRYETKDLNNVNWALEIYYHKGEGVAYAHIQTLNLKIENNPFGHFHHSANVFMHEYIKKEMLVRKEKEKIEQALALYNKIDSKIESLKKANKSKI